MRLRRVESLGNTRQRHGHDDFRHGLGRVADETRKERCGHQLGEQSARACEVVVCVHTKTKEQGNIKCCNNANIYATDKNILTEILTDTSGGRTTEFRKQRAKLRFALNVIVVFIDGFDFPRRKFLHVARSTDSMRFRTNTMKIPQKNN